MKKLYCRECGGILIPNGNTYICEDCKNIYTIDEIKALSMQVNVKAPAKKEKKKENAIKLQMKPFRLTKANPLGIEEKIAPKLTLKSKPNEDVAIKRVRVINPVGNGSDPKDGISNNKNLKTKFSNNDVINSILILASDALDKCEYDNALAHANKLISLDKTYRNAYLIKGEIEALRNSEITIKLNQVISTFHNALIYTKDDEYDDLEFYLSNRYINICKDYLLSKMEGLKNGIENKYIDILKDELKGLDSFAKEAEREINLDIKVYYEALAKAIIDLVSITSKKAIDAFNLERMRQTDTEYLKFKDSMDLCISIWEYLLVFAIRADTISEALESLYNAHRAIVNSCGHKLSGKKVKVSMSITKEEKIIREARIENYKSEILKYYLKDSDIVSYTSFDSELKDLRAKRNKLQRNIKNEDDVKEINSLKEYERSLKDKGRFKEAKEVLSKINSLNRIILKKSRGAIKEIEELDRKILYLEVQGLYKSLD